MGPFAVFYGKYSSKSGQSIFVRIEEANNIITDFDGNQIFDFSYNPLQRRFFINLELSIIVYLSTPHLATAWYLLLLNLGRRAHVPPLRITNSQVFLMVQFHQSQVLEPLV